MAKQSASSQSRSAPSIEPPGEVLDLVARFAEHAEAYHAGRYNETQIRREFIDPLFKALGWDVDNSQGYAEAYKDVIHEDAITVGGATKAPDYCFRIGGVRKFFVEAKKPTVDIQRDANPAFQLRRYAWSAKLPLSILTDFEEIAVYDCRVKPSKTDKASKARTLFLRYDELPHRWGELASIFSREAILKGSFDKYAESARRKRGTAEVDAAFLAEIEDWRDMLARNIALRNPDLSQRDLNFAVQRTIDRIIFLRICEDRGIEPYGTLQGLINGEQVYPRLFERFRRADERYNSGLFHFEPELGRPEGPDDLTPGLIVDDKPLKDMLRRLYYPECPYEFSVLPADILGQVYEQFLGKVIRLTPGHRAMVEEKPEVRKAGGVYYTPTYIVDYIVENTVGKLIEGKTPQEVGALTQSFQPSRAKNARPLTVLDPACGSGSFLLGAYQYLLDWYRDWYVADGPKNHTGGKTPRLYEHPSGEWRLTTAERKRILLSHIHGVDIDSQAVETTKLSLLLKVLEGESAENLDGGLRLFHERALPDLASNIKCGNALIGPDFYDHTQMDMFDADQRLRINVFDWQREFKSIMDGGGFDAVIGNPPYVFGEFHDTITKDYVEGRYTFGSTQYDTYWLFIEQGLRLANDSGMFALIVPDALLARDLATPVRTMLLRHGLSRLYHCGLVFDASVSATVFIVAKYAHHKYISVDTRQDTGPTYERECSVLRFENDPERRFLIHASDTEADMLQRIHDSTRTLSEFVTISRGEEIGRKDLVANGHPIIIGSDIFRYHISPPQKYVKSIHKNPSVYRSPKIVVVKTGRSCVASVEYGNMITMQSVYNIHTKNDECVSEYLAAIINSRFSDYFIYKTFTAYKLLFPQLNQSTLLSIPIPEADDAGDREHLVSLVEDISTLHKQKAEARAGHAKTTIERQIDATDRRIDQLVYKLYGLTDEEIRIIEEATT